MRLKVEKLILLMFLFCLISGCKPKDEELQTYMLPAEIKDYSYFKWGTWWVYEEQNTHVRDCVYVSSGKLVTDTFNSHLGVPGIFEVMNWKTYSSYDACNFQYYTDAAWTITTHTAYGRTPIFKGKHNQQVSEITTSFFSKASINDSYCTSSGCVKFIGKYDSLKINNKYFADVKVFFQANDPTENNDSSFFYYSKNVGIIKKITSSNHNIWNLVYYEIYQ